MLNHTAKPPGIGTDGFGVSNRTEEPIARPVHPAKNTLLALTRKRNDHARPPFPAALPLFATGLGGLGLLGWRRKRKAQAVV